MEQHPIPQDITGFKFKLVGDMTLKQFGELAFGAIMAYVFYVSNWVPFVKWPLVAFFGLLGIALAFMPIEERPLDIWIVNFIRAIYRPTLFVWKKDSGILDYNTSVPTPVPTKQTPTGSPAGEGAQTQLSPWPYAKPGKEKDKGGSETKVENKGAQTVVVTESEVEGAKEPAVKEQVFVGEPPPAKTDLAAAKPALVVQQPAGEKVQATEDQPATSTSPSPSVDELERQRDEKLKELETAKKLAEAAVAEQNIAADKAGVVVEGTIGPFANTKILTVDELAKLREQKVVADDQARGQQIKEGEQGVNKLSEQSKQVGLQIEELRTKLVDVATPAEDIAGLQGQLDNLVQQKATLDNDIIKMQADVSAVRVEPLTKPSYQQPTKNLGGGVKVVPRPAEQPAPTVSLTDLPNVINGIIITDAGMPLDGVIIVIKNKAGNSIRALKTNKAGQFMVSTPMETGVYYLEMEREGYAFDTLEVTLTGVILKPLEITARKA